MESAQQRYWLVGGLEKDGVPPYLLMQERLSSPLHPLNCRKEVALVSMVEAFSTGFISTVYNEQLLKCHRMASSSKVIFRSLFYME